MIRRLASVDAPEYRGLMLEAYERHPDAFTSSVAERAALPIAWWEARLSADPRFRAGGLGGKLVDAVVEHARARGGVKVMQLTATHGNDAAQSLYERRGFTAFGIEPMAVAVGTDYVSKVHMWRRLDDT